MKHTVGLFGGRRHGNIDGGLSTSNGVAVGKALPEKRSTITEGRPLTAGNLVYAVTGGQPVETFVGAIRQIMSEAKGGTVS